MSKEYADALGLAENKRLVNILAYDDFIREENRKDGKQHKVSEDYIHSFIKNTNLITNHTRRNSLSSIQTYLHNKRPSFQMRVVFSSLNYGHKQVYSTCF